MKKPYYLYTRKEKHQALYRETHPLLWSVKDILYICFVLWMSYQFGMALKHSILAPVVPVDSPLPNRGVVQAVDEIKLTPTATPQPQSVLSDTIAYITRKFEPEGRIVVVEAINCFFSESHFNPRAYNYNAWNRSEDKGIAQINSVHRLTDNEAYDYRKNIDKAYEIYARTHDWSAWYGRGCQRLAYK